MAEVKMFSDEAGQTLTVWFGVAAASSCARRPAMKSC